VATRTRWRRAPSQAVPTRASAAPPIAVKRSASFDDAEDDETSALLVCTGACAARSPARRAWAVLSPSWLASCAVAALGTWADSSWTPLALADGGVAVPAAGALLDGEPAVPVLAGVAGGGTAVAPVEAPPAGAATGAPPPGGAGDELVLAGTAVDGAAGAANAQVGEATGVWEAVPAGDGLHQGVLVDAAGGVVSRSGVLDDGTPPEPDDPEAVGDVAGAGEGGAGVVDAGEEGSDPVGTGCEVEGDEGCEVSDDDGCDEVGEGDSAGLVLGAALVGVGVGVVVGVSDVLVDGVGSGALVDGGGSSALGVVPLGAAESSGRASDELPDAAPVVGASEALTEEVARGSSAWAASGSPSTPRAVSPTAPRVRALRAAAGVTGGVQGRRAWRCPVEFVVGADPRRSGRRRRATPAHAARCVRVREVRDGCGAITNGVSRSSRLRSERLAVPPQPPQPRGARQRQQQRTADHQRCPPRGGLLNPRDRLHGRRRHRRGVRRCDRYGGRPQEERPGSVRAVGARSSAGEVRVGGDQEGRRRGGCGHPRGLGQRSHGYGHR